MKTLPNPVSRQEFEQLFQRLSNWGRWGQDDDRGTLNYIRPEHIQAAARLVRTGRSVSLSLPVNTIAGPDNPRPALHYMLHRHDVDIPEGARGLRPTSWPVSSTAIASLTSMPFAMSATRDRF